MLNLDEFNFYLHYIDLKNDYDETIMMLWLWYSSD